MMMNSEISPIHSTLLSAIRASQEFLPSTVPDISTPSALEFSVYLRRNFPFVVRGYGEENGISAMYKWRGIEGRKFLGTNVQDEIEIAVTPNGYALIFISKYI
jgi:hypothetical protein